MYFCLHMCSDKQEVHDSVWNIRQWWEIEIEYLFSVFPPGRPRRTCVLACCFIFSMLLTKSLLNCLQFLLWTCSSQSLKSRSNRYVPTETSLLWLVWTCFEIKTEPWESASGNHKRAETGVKWFVYLFASRDLAFSRQNSNLIRNRSY